MSQAGVLLERHLPVLRYDSHEIYFADSAAIWTDCPGQLLRRFPQETALARTPGDGQVPSLSLDFLRPRAYADGTAVEHEDLIACPTKNYGELARRMHTLPGYANRVYGRSAKGGDGRTWLQYWFFYFYNDFELLGNAFPVGLHEGDWEMIQLRLDEAGASPELALYAQHKSAEARWWADVERVDGVQPVVYVARGSHAAYLSSGRHWQGHWWDHADGRRDSPELTLEIAQDDDPAYAWMRWPGSWGDTKPNPDELFTKLDDESPRGPVGHRQWHDPQRLLETLEDWRRYDVAAAPSAAPARPGSDALTHPPAPAITLARAPGGGLEISYEAAGWPPELEPLQLIATVNSAEDRMPPYARRVPVSAACGVVELPVQLQPAWRYDVTVSLAGRIRDPARAGDPPLTSESVVGELGPA